jgi:pyrimidine-nucleoside phosphorylase
VLDKHSTGGVGDKTTLIVVPILAAAGVPMLKMSGRALGFSGGTVDKLEAIPGFGPGIGVEAAKAQVRRIGAALISQSAELAPADRTLYALRDVTATIESLPLIASSIMSKKLAAGAQRLVLDVKVGRGAFMPTLERGKALATALIAIGEGAGVPTSAVLTDMDEPLGRMVGNALEVEEAVRCLQNDPATEPRLRLLCVELAAHGLVAAEKATDLATARMQVEHLLVSGAGAQKFAEIVSAQGGPGDCDAILRTLPQAPIRQTVTSTFSGRVSGLDAGAIGRLCMALGAGRLVKSDPIDPAVGIELHVKTGDRVATGDAIATLYLRDADAARAPEFADTLRATFESNSDSSLSTPRPSPVLMSLP